MYFVILTHWAHIHFRSVTMFPSVFFIQMYESTHTHINLSIIPSNGISIHFHVYRSCHTWNFSTHEIWTMTKWLFVLIERLMLIVWFHTNKANERKTKRCVRKYNGKYESNRWKLVHTSVFIYKEKKDENMCAFWQIATNYTWCA